MVSDVEVEIGDRGLLMNHNGNRNKYSLGIKTSEIHIISAPLS